MARRYFGIDFGTTNSGHQHVQGPTGPAHCGRTNADGRRI